MPILKPYGHSVVETMLTWFSEKSRMLTREISDANQFFPADILGPNVSEQKRTKYFQTKQIRTNNKTDRNRNVQIKPIKNRIATDKMQMNSFSEGNCHFK